MPATYPKKLIEVSIPLKEINEACAKEKTIRHGHPSTLHLWWARRPLAATRAVWFCQLVDDPSGYVDELIKDKTRSKQAEQELLMEPEGDKDLSPRLRERLIEKERERLHDLVRELVIWENTTNESLLRRARREIEKSWNRHLRRELKPLDTPMPPTLDPFAGGGAIPLEAQRLGMDSHASDLNPVAVLINKAMIEIPPQFAGLPPINPEWQQRTPQEKAATTWCAAQGLAEDIRYFGQWMRTQAQMRIGEIYPPYELTKEIIDVRPDLKKAGYKAGQQLTVLAWIWARTVPSPNPALRNKPVPLVTTFWLSKKSGKEAYVEPLVENGNYRFEIKVGKPKDSSVVEAGTKTGRGANFSCILSGVPLSEKHIKSSAREGRMSVVLMAVVCEGIKDRIYLPPDDTQISAASMAKPRWAPIESQPKNPRWFSPPDYGMSTYGDLFTARQLVALNTFSDLVGEAREQAYSRALVADQFTNDSLPFDTQEQLARAYSDAIATYLAFAVSKALTRNCNCALWEPGMGRLAGALGRQAIPMIWTFAETNPLAGAGGDISGTAQSVSEVLDNLGNGRIGSSVQKSALAIEPFEIGKPIIQTDPPYYDNIGYADLSDFFYIWLRRSLQNIYPALFASVLTPKQEELIAAPYRQGGKTKAEEFFRSGMIAAIERIHDTVNTEFPFTLFYAFKQAEKRESGIASTGWATFLDGLVHAGFSVVGTWPCRTELVGALKKDISALASSIILVCRQRPHTSNYITKREFIDALELELPEALHELQHANLSPVDLPQSAIGPGMAIFSRYAKVIKGDGQPMSVTEALQLINHELSVILDGQVSDMDAHTRFACKWFAQYAFKVGSYGDAANIATAVNVAVEGVVAAGILESAKGKARILRPSELPSDWNPTGDASLTVWEIVHHLIRLAESGSDTDNARILAALPNNQSAEARQLCYRLFTLCDQNGWSQEAQAYNQLITNWQDYSDLAATLEKQAPRPVQGDLQL